MKREAGKSQASSADMLDRVLNGELSNDEVFDSASAVVDAAIWKELSNDLQFDGPQSALFLRQSPIMDQRKKVVASLVAHPERTRRLFRP